MPIQNIQDNDSAYFENIKDTLDKNPSAGQREMAASMNLSLGTTNSLLKRFCQKGWLCMKKLNTHTIQYLITAQGLNILAHRSYHYLKRTWHLVVQNQEKADSIILKAKDKGVTTALLQAQTDAGFLFESPCNKYGINLSNSSIEDMIQNASKYTNTLFITEDINTALKNKLENTNNIAISIIEIIGQ